MSVVGAVVKAVEPAQVGVVPPHDLDCEAAVLSAILLANRDAFKDVSDILHPVHFYSGGHARIFEAIINVEAEGKPIDVVTVGSHLKDHHRLAQVGGMPYLGQILDAAPVLTNARAYAKKIVDYYRLRQGILLCQRAASAGYAEGVEVNAYLAEVERELFRLQGANTLDRSTHVHTLLKGVYADLTRAFQNDFPPGIATGFPDYDRLTVGFHRQELTIVAARPGMGKTSKMIAQAINVGGAPPLLFGDDGLPWQPQGVAFFSLEMPGPQIGRRMIAIHGSISAHRLRTRLRPDDWPNVTLACSQLATMPIEIDDTSGLSITAAFSKTRRIKATMQKAGVRLTAAFFDYLQLMKGEGARSRVEEIGQITRGLKQLAKDEDIAVIAGCQLNRALENRSSNDKKPRIADLRESGDIEQDSDNIVFLHRPAVYGEKDPEGEDGRVEEILAKQRNGPTGMAVCRYVPTSTRFEPMPGYS